MKLKHEYKWKVSGALAGLLLAVVAPAWGQTVLIGAVPAVQAALEDASDGVIKKFKDANPGYSGYTFTVIAKPSGTLKNEIANAIINSTPIPYDLYLAANVADPSSLNSSYPTVVSSPTDYSEGTLMLWSNGDAYGIDAESTPTYFAANYTATEICGAGPYGVAASSVLSNVYGITSASNPKVPQGDSLNDVDDAVSDGGGVAGGVQSGWVTTSLHCSAGEITLPNTSHPNATYQVFYPGAGTYNAAVQAGSTVVRSGGQLAAAQALLNWMATEAGQEAFAYFCLNLNTEASMKVKKAKETKTIKKLKAPARKLGAKPTQKLAKKK